MVERSWAGVVGVAHTTKVLLVREGDIAVVEDSTLAVAASADPADHTYFFHVDRAQKVMPRKRESSTEEFDI